MKYCDLLSGTAVQNLIEGARFACGALNADDVIRILGSLAPFVRVGSAYDGDRLVTLIVVDATTRSKDPVLERVRRIYDLHAPGAFAAIETSVKALVDLPPRLREPTAVCAAVLMRPTEALKLRRVNTGYIERPRDHIMEA
jgi:hypothetical protein